MLVLGGMSRGSCGVSYVVPLFSSVHGDQPREASVIFQLIHACVRSFVLLLGRRTFRTLFRLCCFTSFLGMWDFSLCSPILWECFLVLGFYAFGYCFFFFFHLNSFFLCFYVV